jgi:hypothetical protein
MNRSLMQTQDFYKLARPVQDRLIGCVNGTGLPAPVLAVRGGPLEPYIWLLGAGVCSLALLLLYRIGLGALDNSLAVHTAPFIGGYFVLVALLIFTLVRAAGLIVETRSLPFKPGIYAFPIGVIDARRYKLKIYPIDDLVSTEGPSAEHAFKLAFKGGGAFDFRAKNADAAAKAAETLAGARGQLAAAEDAPGSMRPKALASLDPLQGFVNPLAPTTSIARSVPVWVKYGWAIAPGMGVVLGVCLWLIRNVVSDDKMFAHAKAEDSAAQYRAYLSRGSRHKPEVEIVLLPRAELREAREKGTVDAMEAYIAMHPKTGIPTEIQEALRTAMAKELEEAKEAGTVTALKDFATRHPNHHMETDLKAAMHGVYAAALDRYRKSDAPKDPAVSVFVEKLLALAEARNNPKVELRFHRRSSRSLERADSMLSKNRYFMGTVSFPTKYQDGPHMKPREEDTAKKVIARFNKAFPTDVLSLEAAAPVDDPDGPLPSITTPTWFVEYNAEWDGGARTSDRPRGVWVGVGYTYESAFKLPDESGAKPLKNKWIVWRAPNIQDLEPDERPEEKVYENEAEGAFDQLAKKLTGVVFAD